MLPHLLPSDQVVLIHIFSKTIAAGTNNYELSYLGTGKRTGLNWLTVKKSTGRLEKMGLITPVGKANKRKTAARIYMVDWPPKLERILAYDRKKKSQATLVALKSYAESISQGTPSPTLVRESFVQHLTPEDIKSLNDIISTLLAGEALKYKAQAAKELKEGDDMDEKYREVVARNRFGPSRLEKYKIYMSSDTGGNDG